SDNGIPFPGAKTTVYDAGLRLPLIVRKPGQKKGVVSKAMVSWVDVLPTMLDWCGVKPPKVLQGRSFLGIVEEADPKGWDEVYASHTLRGHDVLSHARRADAAVQVRAEPGPQARLPVRVGPVRLADLAGGAEGRREDAGQALQGCVREPAGGG